MNERKQFILHPPKEDFSFCEDWTDASFGASAEDIAEGKALLQNGKVGCLLLAGGQGSRLGESVAKGKVPVSVIQNKSLFQIFFEQILYAGRYYGIKLPIAVMTSSLNHEETIAFLTEHNLFGLSEDQVYFFTQDDLPFCDEEGNSFSEDSPFPIKGPDGNGKALHRMYSSGVLNAFLKAGVEYVNVIQIDNPLADPFDAGFIGFHKRSGGEVSVIAVTKEFEGEKAGMLASDKGRCRVIEYTEKLDKSFSLLNTGLFCFDAAFINRIGKENANLPWHAAYKKIAQDTFAWKFEYFLFDVFTYANKVSVLVKPRAECFSPLKNATGDKSLETVQRDLLRRDRALYKVLTGKEPPNGKIELSFAFRYPTEKKPSVTNSGYMTPEDL